MSASSSDRGNSEGRDESAVVGEFAGLAVAAVYGKRGEKLFFEDEEKKKAELMVV